MGYKKSLKITAFTLTLALVPSVPVLTMAATLDFNEILPAGQIAQPSLTLSNATINNENTNGFLVFDGLDPLFPGTNGKGALCAFGNFKCLDNMEILFNQDIQNLNIGFSGYDQGDEVFVSGWKDGVSTGAITVTGQNSVDFSSFGIIDRLYFFNDSLTAAGGLIYRDFDFDIIPGTQNTLVTAVPLPAALPLFGTVLGLLGLQGWRKRKKT